MKPGKKSVIQKNVISDETREKMRNSLSTLEVRERMSRNHRKPENSHLPMYVRKIRKTRPSNNTIYTGYAVCFPGKGEKYFVSSKLSDEEKLQLAIEYINNNGDGPTTK